MPLAHLSMLIYNKKSHQTQAEEYLKLQVHPLFCLINYLLTLSKVWNILQRDRLWLLVSENIFCWKLPHLGHKKKSSFLK